MTKTRTALLLSAMALLSGCLNPPPRPTEVGGHITGELDKA